MMPMTPPALRATSPRNAWGGERYFAIVSPNDARILMTGTRDGAIARAEQYFDDGGFLAELQRRVAIPTTSQEQGSMPALQEYVSGEMTRSLEKLGYDSTVLPNPRTEYGPFLIARRIEDPAKPTVLTYGHGDVIRGQEEQWRQGLSPWKIVIEGDRMYGRGTADNKGQHTINMAHALATITDARGQIKVPEWRPKTLTNSVRAALADAVVDAGEGAPEIDPEWGEKSLTPVERVFGWNSFEVLAFKTGN